VNEHDLAGTVFEHGDATQAPTTGWTITRAMPEH